MSRPMVAGALAGAGTAMTITAVTIMWGAPALAIAGLVVLAVGMFALDIGGRR